MRQQWNWITAVAAALGPLAVIALFIAGGCAADDLGEPRLTDADNVGQDGEPAATPDPREDAQREWDRLIGLIEAAADMTADDFVQVYSLQEPPVSYDPTEAAGLSIIQDSALALDEGELEVLSEQGLVISERLRFPSFAYGYETIYFEDLPLLVSADSIMSAVHRSYDDMLERLELAVLLPDLDALLDGMRTSLEAGELAGLGAQAEADVDLYLAVALSLLRDRRVVPVAGASERELAGLYAAAQGAEGWFHGELFGVERDVDFSQFLPRGHYTDDPSLESYFQSMMWLGRIDFRLIETQPDLTQTFQRRQLEASVGLYQLLDDPELMATWRRIDDTIRAFAGESDNLTVDEMANLLADLGVLGVEELARVGDGTIAQAIVDGGYGTQQIASHIMINGLRQGTMPLSSTFQLFGQRYVVDSHVFANVVYDRVQGGGVFRMMPSPLDVAFAVLQNDRAGQLLAGELAQYHYAPDLHAMRLLVDAHGEAFWHANLYNLRLAALRALSPVNAPEGLPTATSTKAWHLRLLNAQLASWAELRHDTILYAKPSYTAGDACEFPDAYVDPYPQFYAALVEFARYGASLVETLEFRDEVELRDRFRAYFAALEETAATLQEMAEYELAGRPFNADQMAFINRAVVVHHGCGEATAEGWYAELHFRHYNSAEYDPTIADVHTQPTEVGGAPVGRVLHVGTGMPRLMVVTVDTCNGPRAYAGLASAYFERITEDFQRLDDMAWSEELGQATPDDVAWMQALVVRPDE